MEIRYRLTRPGARPPVYATPGAAAADLCAALDAPLTLEPGGRALVPTGLAIQLPGPDWVALVFARSGLGIRKGIALSNGVGVIDSDYRGEIGVGLVNLGAGPYTLQPGERVAQLMLTPVARAAFVPAETLEATDRGEGGFGSTGRLAIK